MPMLSVHLKVLNVLSSPVRGELWGRTCSREDIPPPQAAEAALGV